MSIKNVLNTIAENGFKDELEKNANIASALKALDVKTAIKQIGKSINPSRKTKLDILKSLKYNARVYGKDITSKFYNQGLGGGIKGQITSFNRPDISGLNIKGLKQMQKAYNERIDSGYAISDAISKIRNLRQPLQSKLIPANL